MPHELNHEIRSQGVGGVARSLIWNQRFSSSDDRSDLEEFGRSTDEKKNLSYEEVALLTNFALPDFAQSACRASYKLRMRILVHPDRTV